MCVSSLIIILLLRHLESEHGSRINAISSSQVIESCVSGCPLCLLYIRVLIKSCFVLLLIP
ncbi:hypothetical protein M758_3G175300 [Ceratodon purpureus]|uniref:Uncharacterized protein n=1 Tax=Ceratodon purpureus TaxID=3225 RepID=A0A8T0IM84_CERPU|nr:hypothetical protein KC19_3G173000 [Ceratodon purpureus]KAG0623444.1 hypothetical protein M758_3G175300 [Ceratodon purpureus]